MNEPVKSTLTAAAKRVYYVLARRKYFAPGFEYRGKGGTYARTPANAIQFDSVGAIIDRLQGKLSTDATAIIRVEETASASAPRRELVTSGDLSLLDKGPVVILYHTNDAGTQFFLRGWNSNGSVEMSGTTRLSEAGVFKNVEAVSEFLGEYAVEYGSLKSRIVPIREIPGETIVTETVLA